MKRGEWRLLAISCIGFEHTRHGEGTAFVKFISQTVKTHGFKYLAIEYANKNSSCFAQALGFSPYKNEKSWIIDIENLLN